MVLDLNSVNQILDLVLKLVLLGILIFVIVIMRHLDKAIRSARGSADSVKHMANKLSRAFYAKTAFDVADMGYNYLRKRRPRKDDE